MNWLRLQSLIIKEFLSIFRNKRSRSILFLPPLAQLFIFSYAATLDVKHTNILVLNQDNGIYSTELINRIQATQPIVDTVTVVHNMQDINTAIDQQTASAVIEIPSDFSRKILRNETAPLQIILDGRRLNSSQILSGYLQKIINQYANELKVQQGKPVDPISISQRNWFNENLIFKWFMIPNLIGSMLILASIIIIGLSLAREREQGTFDQLLVSPLTINEIILGKMIPPICIGMVQLIVFSLLAILFLSLPFHGSFLLLIFSGFFFVVSLSSIGLLLSTLAFTQQQAVLIAFLFIAPTILLSGSLSPIENMPEWLQVVTYFNPLRYFLVAIRDLFLKNISFMQIINLCWPLVVLSTGSLTIASFFFKKRMK